MRCASIAFADGTTQTQREILSSLGLNHRIKSKELFIDLHSWFSVLKNGEKELMPDIERLEPKDNITIQGQKEVLTSIRPRLCAEQDLNLRSPKASDLQSDVIDRSTIDAYRRLNK